MGEIAKGLRPINIGRISYYTLWNDGDRPSLGPISLFIALPGARETGFAFFGIGMFLSRVVNNGTQVGAFYIFTFHIVYFIILLSFFAVGCFFFLSII